MIFICIPTSNVVERIKNTLRISFIICFLLVSDHVYMLTFQISCLVLIKLTRVIRTNESRADEIVLILIIVFFVAAPIFKAGSPVKRFTTLIVYAALVSRYLLLSSVYVIIEFRIGIYLRMIMYSF